MVTSGSSLHTQLLLLRGQAGVQVWRVKLLPSFSLRLPRARQQMDVALTLCMQALKKSINGIINKINTANIKSLLAEVFREVRPGRVYAVCARAHMARNCASKPTGYEMIRLGAGHFRPCWSSMKTLQCTYICNPA